MASIVTTVAVCYSQEVPRDFLSGGRKSVPSAIQHSNPFLFTNSNKGFLLVWDDYRNDSLAYYAQLFDSLGNAVGKNFPIFSNTLIAFGPDSSFFTEKYEYVDIGGGFSELDWTGYICKFDGTWLQSFFDRSSPLFPTDCVGIYCASGGYDLVGSEYGYVDLSGNGGSLSISASDWTKKGLWNWNTG